MIILRMLLPLITLTFTHLLSLLLFILLDLKGSFSLQAKPLEVCTRLQVGAAETMSILARFVRGLQQSLPL